MAVERKNISSDLSPTSTVSPSTPQQQTNAFEGAIAQARNVNEEGSQNLTGIVRHLFQNIHSLSYQSFGQPNRELDIAGYGAKAMGSGSAQLTIPTSDLQIGDGVFTYTMSSSEKSTYGESSSPESITVGDNKGGSRKLTRDEIIKLGNFISQKGLNRDDDITAYRDAAREQQKKKEGYNFSPFIRKN
jgi:hypothetical protein